MAYVGVDEAGKGPVLGPMIAAAVRARPADVPDDVDDSKRVDPERRRSIASILRSSDRVDLAIVAIEPATIDDPETDMNTLTVVAQARAVRRVAHPGDRVLADAGDVSESRFADRLADSIAVGGGGIGKNGAKKDGVKDIDVSATHGADESDPIVGAASIVAKVARDARVEIVDRVYGEYAGVGSGYPSDTRTREFLEAYVSDHGSVPACARRSWATCETVLANVEQSGLDDF